MEQTPLPTRAEEIAAEEYPENEVFSTDDMGYPISYDDNRKERAAFAKGYARGQQDRWISVAERLPDDGQSVLTYTPDYSFFKKCRIIAYGSIGGGFPCEVTHWMPLPSPPNPEQR